MLRELLRLSMIGVVTLSLVGSAFADELKGTISKVEDEGRENQISDKWK